MLILTFSVKTVIKGGVENRLRLFKNFVWLNKQKKFNFRIFDLKDD